MIKRCLAAPALALALSASPSFAQEDAGFTGPRIAATAGWDDVQHNGENGSGFSYGGTAGYDFAFGSFRVGPEGEITASTQKDNFGPASARYSERADRDLYAGARVGYVVTPSLLVYAKAGYTNAQFTIRTADDDRHRDRSGVRAGVGAEYALTQNFFLTGEYRYSNYGADYSRNQILGGVGVRF